MIYHSSYISLSVRLGPGSFNVLTVLNIVVYAFNCKYKSRYHSFYLLYDTEYKEIRVFMYIYCSPF